MQTNWTRSARRQVSEQGDDGVAHCLTMLEDEVMKWMSTHKAWDERKHPAILQFVQDIREYCGRLNGPRAVTIAAISVELNRLKMKINDSSIDARIEDLQQVLQAYIKP